MSNEAVYKPEDVFKEYYGRLCYFAFQFVNDKAVAEDLVQDAFVAYWDRKNNVSDHPQAIKDFLYRSVKNASLNLVKRQKVQQRYFFTRDDEKFEKEKVLESLIQAEAMANLHHAIEQLPESCKNVFQLAYFEGLTNPEIAQNLNISINTVRCHKYNGLKILRSQLDIEAFIILFAIVNL